jgi:mgtE-like transporter
MALRRSARALWAHWRAERRALGQGLVALVLSTAAGFLAGLTLAHLTDRLDRVPGLLVLIPAAVGMRGTIFGAIGARLGTANAAGTFAPTIRPDGVLHRNAEVAVITTLTSSIWLALLARVVSAAFGHPSVSLWGLVTISVVGGVLGSAVILAATVALSVRSFRRGWDLDSVSTPVVTALGDVATLPTLFAASLLLECPVVNAVTAVICVAATAVAVVRVAARSAPEVRRIVLHMTGVIALTPLLDILAGSLLQSREAELLAVPAMLLVIPPFVSQAGALGGIFSSRVTSKIQLGVVEPRGWPQPVVLADGALVAAVGLFVFALIGVGGFGLAALTHVVHPGVGAMVEGTVLAGTLTLPLLLVVGYALAVVATRLELDPDDHSVPIVTSVMDVSGIAAILLAMTILGAGVR